MNFFDLHCDTISECYSQKVAIDKNHLQLSLCKGKKINEWVQVYAIWMDDTLEGENAYQHFCNVYDYFMQQLEYQQSRIALCKSPYEVDQCLAQNKRVAVLAVEGSRALGGKIERVSEFYEKGVRLMTLTWNGKSEVGDGCMVENAGGLTTFGQEVVQQMEKLGMVVDVSHLAERGFWQVAKLTKRPFIATHSNSKSICNVPRNLTDDQFRVMVERCGLVGINFYPLFINGTMKAYLNELIPHIDHFLELGGEKIIAMGSDFDGAKMPADLKNISCLNRLYDLVVQRYGKEKAEMFFFENAYAFFKRNLG